MKKTFLVAVSCRRWWFSSCWRSQAGSAVSSNAMSTWSSFPPTRYAATGVGRCRSTAGSSIRRRIRFAAAPPRTSFGESLGLDEVPAQSDLFGERPPVHRGQRTRQRDPDQDGGQAVQTGRVRHGERPFPRPYCTVGQGGRAAGIRSGCCLRATRGGLRAWRIALNLKASSSSSIFMTLSRSATLPTGRSKGALSHPFAIGTPYAARAGEQGYRDVDRARA